MPKVKLAAPWTIYYRQLQALFKLDKEIYIDFDEDFGTIKLYVSNATKAEALKTLLPKNKKFGNVTVPIHVISGPDGAPKSESDVHDVFAGNDAVSYISVVDGIFNAQLIYVMFKKEVVQFFNDNISDRHGLCSTLYQDIANEVFGEIPNVFFCTEIDSEA